MFAVPDGAESTVFAVQMRLAQVLEWKRGHSIVKGTVKDRS